MNDFDRAETEHELQGYIELPKDVDLVALVKKAYELSRPQGMGMLHFQPGPLPDHVAPQLVGKETSPFPVNLDYVMGRAVKFTVTRHLGRLFVAPRWFDHTEADYRELLASVGVTPEPDALRSGLR